MTEINPYSDLPYVVSESTAAALRAKAPQKVGTRLSVLRKQLSAIHEGATKIRNPDWYDNLTEAGRAQFDVFKQRLNALLGANPRTDENNPVALSTSVPIILDKLNGQAIEPFLLLHHITLVGANLENADLRNVNLQSADLRNANLKNAKLARADLSNARLDKANFSDTILVNAIFKQAHLRDANFENANLNGVAFSHADLESANLIRTNLVKASLCKADLKYAKLQNANLFGADLYEADLFSTDFKQANLEQADLGRAILHCANFRNANLNGASLYATKLYDVNFCEADLRGANFDLADLDKAQFSTLTEFDPTTKLNITAKELTLDGTTYSVSTQKTEIMKWFEAKGAKITFFDEPCFWLPPKPESRQLLIRSGRPYFLSDL